MLDSPVKHLLSHDVIEWREGFVRIRFDAKSEFMIPGNVVQGGIVTAMLDHAMAAADDGRFATAALRVDILRPVAGPDLFVTAKITRRGRRMVFAEAEMFDEDGNLLARGTQTAVPFDQPAGMQPEHAAASDTGGSK